MAFSWIAFRYADTHKHRRSDFEPVFEITIFICLNPIPDLVIGSIREKEEKKDHPINRLQQITMQQLCN